MKKIVFTIIFLLLFLTRYEYHDLTRFQSETKQVEIKGEVHNPGLYDVDKNATINEIIDLAGGINKDADVDAINQTANIENHAVIVIPKIQEHKKISINSASLEELDTLKGIGPKVAQRILDYRDKAPFKTLEELKEVKGIGDKLYEQILSDIVL